MGLGEGRRVQRAEEISAVDERRRPHSILIGVVAGLLCNIAVHIKSRSTLDDTLDVFPCHGVGGIAGMLLTGILARDVGLLWGETTTFMYHLLALVIVSTFSFFMSLGLFHLTGSIIPLRVSPEQEAVGLDLSQHAECLVFEPCAPREQTARDATGTEG